MKRILILSVVPIAILACGDTNDNTPIIHHVVTPEPKPADDFPEVPEGYPEDLMPIWLSEFFDGDPISPHVITDRVLIALWNQGERGFLGAIYKISNGIAKVYPLYPNVAYISWDTTEEFEDPPDGRTWYVAGAFGTPETVPLRSDLHDKFFTKEEVEEIMAGEGDFMAKHPGMGLLDEDKTGYKPKDVLVDYCNQPGNRARVPYCR